MNILAGDYNVRMLMELKTKNEALFAPRFSYQLSLSQRAYDKGGSYLPNHKAA